MIAAVVVPTWLVLVLIVVVVLVAASVTNMD